MSNTQSADDHDHPDETEALDVDSLRTQVAVLREENNRLRSEYARARQTAYRRTATALVATGILAVVAGIVLSGVRDVLLVIGAIGVFGGILTWYLTPERVLTATVSDSIYQALAANGSTIRDELGLQTTAVYLPNSDGVRVFLPQHRDFDVPDPEAGMFVTADTTRGVFLTPAGQMLLDEFERAQAAPTGESLAETTAQLGDAVVEQFEIADAVSVAKSSTDDRMVVTIEGAAFGPVTTFDHPAVSVIACGLASAHDGPLAVDPIDDTTVAFETDVPPLSA